MKIKSLSAHLPVLILLVAVVYGAFGRTMSAPLWNPLSFEVLHDAELLSRDVGVMFRSAGNLVSQPVLQLLFLAEYRLFGLETECYHAASLLVHSLNSFLVYLLVNMLFPRRRMAVLASLLFALTVGSYGKILLSLASQEALLLAHLYLLVLYCLIRNDFRHRGGIFSPWFVFALGLFVLAGLTAPATFSLLGCLIAYKFFFRDVRERRPVLSADLLVLIAAGVLFFIAQHRFGQQAHISFSESGGALRFTWISFKNIFRYLTLMLFPVQYSPLLQGADSVVRFVYDARTVIRVFLALAITSFSFFGLVFGSQALRFFIAWTYITVLPFTGIDTKGQWLNLQYLYLVALGFCVILAAGTTGCADLLGRHRFRRWLPYAVPALFALGALSLTHQLDAQNRRQAQSHEIRQLRARLEAAVFSPSADDTGKRGNPPPPETAEPRP